MDQLEYSHRKANLRASLLFSIVHLVELQIQLVRWQQNWSCIWVDPDRHRKVVEQLAVGQIERTQPAHAADRLPRRGLSSLALVSCLLVKYTCRQSRPARCRSGLSVAPRLRRHLARHLGGLARPLGGITSRRD